MKQSNLEISSDSTTWNWGPRSSASSWSMAFIWAKKDWDRIEFEHLSILRTWRYPSGSIGSIIPARESTWSKIPNWKVIWISDASDLRVRELCPKNGFKRWNYAKNLIASIAYMANQQAFPILFYVSRWKVSQKVAPSPKASSANYLSMENKIKLPVLGRSVKQGYSRSLKSKQKELIIFRFATFSKGIWWIEIGEQMQASKKEIVLFRIFGWSGVEFWFRKEFQIFEDLEGQSKYWFGMEQSEKPLLMKQSGYLTILKESLVSYHPQVHINPVKKSESIADVHQ